jgi:protein SCO1/2
MNRRVTAVLFLVGLVALAGIIVGLRGISSARTSTAEPAGQTAGSSYDGALLPPGVRPPQFTLRDQDGRRVTMRGYRGRPVVVTFLYSHCKDTCPVQAQQIRGALDDLGHDVPVLAVSVDPPGDTQRSAKRFNRKQHVVGRIRWVLGSEPQLSRLWKGFAIIPQSDQQEHMARIVLIDRRGFQKVGFPASQTTPERLAHDLRLLEKS